MIHKLKKKQILFIYVLGGSVCYSNYYDANFDFLSFFVIVEANQK